MLGKVEFTLGEKRLDGASWLGREGLETSLCSVRELERLPLHLFTGDPAYLGSP